MEFKPVHMLVVTIGMLMCPCLALEVQQWTELQIALTATIHHDDPYHTVEVNGTFTLENGSKYLMPAFWDGNQTWRLRFAPPVVGLWNYSTSTNTEDPGLNSSGSFQCTKYSGTNPNYQHGFLRASNNSSRYLEYNDGTPFYWLGDTHWSGFQLAEHWTGSNNASYKSMFKGMVDARVAQGFSVWKAETFVINDESGNAAVNDGGHAWSDSFFGVPNPAFWQSIDKRVDYVTSKGMVVSFAGFGIGRGMPSPTLLPKALQLVRYIVARYASKPVVWLSCQEYCANGCTDCWAQVAALTYHLDPYHRANSLHNCASNPIAFHNEPWYTHVTLQQGHNVNKKYSYWFDQYNALPAKPILEDEANYELLAYDGHVEHGPSWMTRQSAWMSQISGTFGFTYGGQGIWWACWNETYVNGNCGTVGSSDYRVWYETLSFEVGGRQLSLMADFFRQLPWYELVPDPEAITWSGATPTSSQRPFQKSLTNRSIVVAYLPIADGPAACCSGRYNGTVNGLNSETTYTARWFNPRDGSYTLIASHISGVTTWPIPASPTQTDDWVLLFEARASIPMALPFTSFAGQLVSGTSLVTSVSLNGRIRIGSGLTGCNFTVGSKDITVTALGRYKVHGNCYFQKLLLLSSTNDTIVGEASVSMKTGVPDTLGFVFAQPDTPIKLSAGSSYYLLSNSSGCDSFYDDVNTKLVTTSAASIVGSIYGSFGNFHHGAGGAGSCYGPLNLMYSL